VTATRDTPPGDAPAGSATARSRVLRNRGPLFWIALVPGWWVIIWAVRGVQRQRGGTVPKGFLHWFVGAGVVHDALVLPAAYLVAVATRRIPAVVRHPVQAGLAVTAVLFVFSWPLLRDSSKRASNPTVLPLRYGTGFATVLGVVWAGVAVAIVAGVVTHRWKARR
jgi:hypothetical protein